MTLTQGSPVYHGDHHGLTGHGLGTVVAEWGPWYCCRNCFDELTGVILPKTDVETGLTEPWKPVKCRGCGQRVLPLPVNGSDIFDCQFADGISSIHRDWLRSPRRGS